MELSFNNGTAFVYIRSKDLIGLSDSLTGIISKDVISFSITEELGKLTTGNISLHDPAGIYSRILRNGMSLEITFGYKAWNVNLLSLGLDSKVSKSNRTGLKAIIQTPSGAGDENGQTTYNATFMGLEILDIVKHKVFDSGARYQVVSDTMDDMNIKTKIIDFMDSSNALDTRSIVVQDETPSKFLSRMAGEWGAIFRVADASDGSRVGLFVDTKKIDSPTMKGYFAIAHQMDDSKNLYYNCGQESNVKSFDWQQHIGESGQGDGTSISYVGGKAIFTKYVANDSGTVTLWELDMDSVNKATKNGENVQTDMEILNAKKFDEVKKYFKPVLSPIAPQGMGFTINVKMHGDPLLTTFLRINFKGGFPAILTQANTDKALTTFYVKRATHTFNKSEYTTDLEIVDSYSVTGSFIQAQSSSELIGLTK